MERFYDVAIVPIALVVIIFLIITVHLGPRSRVSDRHALHQVIRRRLHVDRLTVAAKGVFALGEGDLIDQGDLWVMMMMLAVWPFISDVGDDETKMKTDMVVLAVGLLLAPVPILMSG